MIGPSGIQALITNLPSAVSTRSISRAAAAGSLAKMTANTDSTTSMLASSSGSDSAAPRTKVICRPEAAAAVLGHLEQPRRGVDTGHPGTMFGSQQRGVPRAAAEIEDPITGIQLRALHDNVRS